MFANFNQIDFIILGASFLMNVIFIICIIILIIKNNNNKKSALDKIEEVKVTQVNESEEVNSFEDIIEAMQKDIDSEKENAVELFEQEQEEKAIISYQELLNAKNKVEKKEVEKQIIPDIEEVLEIEEKPKATPVLATPQPKFTNSEFVSPVFGKMDRNAKNNVQLQVEEDEYKEHELERTLNIEPLTEEIKKNNEFLNALKEFRKNL